jgi:biotin carboxyl carrier protein
VTTQYEAEINGRVRHVSVHREDGAFLVSVDGREWMVDASRVDAHTVSLLVSEKIRLKPEPTRDPVGSGFSRTFSRTDSRSSSYEATVTPDPATGQLTVRIGAAIVPVTLNGRRRWGRKEEGALSATGPERVVAPMPGKVVRVLVQQGEAVRARQPIVVIEAMKMENELRSGRDGTVAELPVRDGQSVDAGTLLAVITGAAGSR